MKNSESTTTMGRITLSLLMMLYLLKSCVTTKLLLGGLVTAITNGDFQPGEPTPVIWNTPEVSNQRGYLPLRNDLTIEEIRIVTNFNNSIDGLIFVPEKQRGLRTIISAGAQRLLLKQNTTTVMSVPKFRCDTLLISFGTNGKTLFSIADEFVMAKVENGITYVYLKNGIRYAVKETLDAVEVYFHLLNKLCPEKLTPKMVARGKDIMVNTSYISKLNTVRGKEYLLLDGISKKVNISQKVAKCIQEIMQEVMSK